MFSGRSVRGRGVIVLVGLLMGVMPVARAGEEASSFEARFQRVVERLEKMRQENHAPGMAIGVVRGDAAEGEGVLLHAFGLADVEGGRPVTPDTRFAIGSTTKAMTATLIAQLVEQGKMDWDEPVRAHVPGFRLSDPDANEKVTIRDLLCHRAGLASLPSLWYGTEASAEDIVEAVGRAELLHPFREVFEYSNVSYMIAGMAAANGAGAESWHELIREQLLEPLGMAGATTREAEALSDPEQARGYAWDEETEGLRVLPLRRLDVIAPAGAVNASAREMTHWLRMLLDRGEFEGRRIVGREALEQTWEPQMPAFGVEYALGWLVSEWRGRRMLTHTGGIDGFAAIVVVMPDDDLAYALLINRGGSAVSGLSQHVVLEGMLGELGGEGDGAPAGDAESDGEWARLTGTYVANFGPFTDASFEVLVSDGKLAIDIPGQVTYQLRAPDAEGKRAFVLTDDVKIRFNETEDGEVYSLTLFQAGYRFEAPRKGVEQPKTPVDVAAVRGYLGSYRFDALGVDVEILIERDRLAIDVPGQTTYMLQNADERGRWVFDVKDSIWVEFDEEDGAAPGTLVPSITLVQDGHESVLPRVERAGGEEGVPSADELVDAVRAALGGEALGSLRAVRMVGETRAVNQGLTARVESIETRDGRLRMVQDCGPFGTFVTVADGERGVIEFPSAPGHVMSGAEVEAVRRGSAVYWLTDWRTLGRVAVQERTEFDGREAYLVRIDMESGGKVEWFVDAGSMLPIALRMDAHEVGGAVVSRFSEYREVGGVMLAHEIATQSPVTGRTVLRFDVIEPNPEIPAGAFEVATR